MQNTMVVIWDGWKEGRLHLCELVKKRGGMIKMDNIYLNNNNNIDVKFAMYFYRLHSNV